MVLKLPPRLPMPSPITKIVGIAGHLFGQGFERGLHVGDLRASPRAAGVFATSGRDGARRRLR